MKKLVVLFTAVLAIFTLSGCEIIGKSEMLIALANMETMDNYKMDITIELDGEEFVTSYTYVVGDYQQSHILGQTVETFMMDGTVYTLKHNWFNLPILEETDEYDEDDYSDFNIFLESEFSEDEDGYYVLESDSEIFDGIDTIKFLIEDQKVQEMILEGEMEVFGETFTMGAIIEYSEFNEVDIEAPKYITDEEFDQMNYYLEEFQVTDIYLNDNDMRVFSIVGWPMMDCNQGHCWIEAEPGMQYDFDNQLLSLDSEENYMSVEDFLVANPEADITAEYFEFVHYYYELFHKYK